VRLSARTYYAFVTTCPTCGKLAVYIDGKKVRTVDTYSGRTRYRVAVTLFTARKDVPRHVVLKVLGGHSSRSRGNDVFLDAMSTKS
jgi:hypothetical protein